MKRTAAIIGIMLLVGACAQRSTGVSQTTDKAEAPRSTTNGAQTALCPVMGDPIDRAVSIKTDDGSVCFCCKGCIAKYKANPAKYADRVIEQRRILAAQP